MADHALRKAPLAGRHGGSAGARVTPAAPATRLSLRAGEDAIGTLSLAFGLELRTARGLPAELIQPDAEALLKSLISDELIKVEDGFVRLQRQGKMLVDSIALALLG